MYTVDEFNQIKASNLSLVQCPWELINSLLIPASIDWRDSVNLKVCSLSPTSPSRLC